MTSSLRFAASLLALSLALAPGPPARAQAPDAVPRRVVVLTFPGAEGARVRGAVVAGLEDHVTLVDVDLYERALARAVGPTRPDRIAAACRTVGVDAAIEGTMSRIRRAWAVEIVVRDCQSGEKLIPGGRTVVTMRNLGGVTTIRGVIWARIGAAIASTTGGVPPEPECVFDEDEPPEGFAGYAEWVRRRNEYLVRCQQEHAAAVAARPPPGGAARPAPARRAARGRRNRTEPDPAPAALGLDFEPVPDRPVEARRAPRATALSLMAGFAFVNRHLSVEVVDADGPRTYTAPGYPELTLGVELFPIAPFSATSAWRGLGLFGIYRHGWTPGTSGRSPTDLEGEESIRIETGAEELLIGAIFKTVLGGAARGPVLQVSAGYGYQSFELESAQVAQLREDSRIPTMDYRNVVLQASLAIPLVGARLAVEAGGSFRYVMDVGDDARNVFGAETDSGYGLGARLGVGGALDFLVRGFFWQIAGEYCVFETEFGGRSAFPSDLVDAFENGTDQYVRGLFLAAYRFR